MERARPRSRPIIASVYGSSPEAQPAESTRSGRSRSGDFDKGFELVEVAEEVALADGELLGQGAQLVARRLGLQAVEVLRRRSGSGVAAPPENRRQLGRPRLVDRQPQATRHRGAKAIEERISQLALRWRPRLHLEPSVPPTARPTDRRPSSPAR